MPLSSAPAPFGLFASRETLLVGAIEHAVEEVAEGDEDGDDESRLCDLLSSRDVVRQHHDRHEHDWREDEAALEGPAP